MARSRRWHRLSNRGARAAPGNLGIGSSLCHPPGPILGDSTALPRVSRCSVSISVWEGGGRPYKSSQKYYLLAIKKGFCYYYRKCHFKFSTSAGSYETCHHLYESFGLCCCSLRCKLATAHRRAGEALSYSSQACASYLSAQEKLLLQPASMG